ncbi:cytochrome c3 family protein [Pseudodesulfovibrio tunisiensis]|uniref:cytochrome c3 family protein n=1 Tax=Pseudodesulfovibrio tunisiensis TaxID=463192 RepID=UPI001FB493B7|nr:cytochrome c3 family protein [Pseudodesulfovibrio tunisiensis]
MNKRYLTISVLTGLLFLTAVVGYLIPADSEAVPVRLLLANKGGKVILDHQAHAAWQNDRCGDCHHTSGNDPKPPRCGECHARKFDQTFADTHQDLLNESQCAACHHPSATIDNFSHDAHVEDYTDQDCQACHHPPDIDPGPQSCANCHADTAENGKPSLRDAAHARCADCHDEYIHSETVECGFCHVRKQEETGTDTACSACHPGPTDTLLPTRTKAFHGQCMGCHETQDTGPFGERECNQCHMK